MIYDGLGLLSQEQAQAALERAFGDTVHGWPVIPERKPRFWQRAARRRERRINSALASIGRDPITDKMRRRYWRQVRLAQGPYEDAGGAMWRAWAFALGYTVSRGPSYADEMDRLLREAGVAP